MEMRREAWELPGSTNVELQIPFSESVTIKSYHVSYSLVKTKNSNHMLRD